MMRFAAIAALVVMILVTAALVCGSAWLERRWRNRHPPDDWDGMREDRRDDDD